MTRKFTTLLLALAMLAAAGGTDAFARAASDPQPAAAGRAAPEAKQESQPEGKLRSDISKLVADARAGRTAAAVPRPQQPAQSNNLSKRAKVTIAVVVAAVVITAVVIASKGNDGPSGNVRIF